MPQEEATIGWCSVFLQTGPSTDRRRGGVVDRVAVTTSNEVPPYRFNATNMLGIGSADHADSNCHVRQSGNGFLHGIFAGVNIQTRHRFRIVAD